MLEGAQATSAFALGFEPGTTRIHKYLVFYMKVAYGVRR